MMAKTRRAFTPAFKREAVALLESSGRAHRRIVAELEIQPSMLRRWRSALMRGCPPPRTAGSPGTAPESPVASPSDQAAAIACLRRELDRTRMERDVLKKRSAPWWRCPREDAQVTFAFIERDASTWPVRLMCRVLEVSDSSHYGLRSRAESAQATSNRQRLDIVRRIHAGHHRRCGSPRVHAALRANGPHEADSIRSGCGPLPCAGGLAGRSDRDHRQRGPERGQGQRGRPGRSPPIPVLAACARARHPAGVRRARLRPAPVARS